MKNTIQLIRGRRSVRTFDGKMVSPEDREKLQTFASDIRNPYGIPVKFKFLSAQEQGLTCPVVTGTDLYVAAKICKGPHMEEAFGYSFEQFVLYAQSLGMGTVWLGGTMDRKAFEQAMDLAEEERMPCASPLGYPAEKMSLKESAMRLAIKADERVPFESLFFDGSFDAPLTVEKAGALAQVLEAVRWSPTAANKQPIRAVITDKAVHFYVKHSKGFASDRAGDMQKIDLGIALCHFELAAKEVGMNVRFALCDPEISAPNYTEYVASWLLSQ